MVPSNQWGLCFMGVMRHSERKPRARILLKLHYHFGAIGDLWPKTRCDLPSLSLGSIRLNKLVKDARWGSILRARNHPNVSIELGDRRTAAKEVMCS